MTFNLQSDAEVLRLIETDDPTVLQGLFTAANIERQKYYGKKVFFRGLIEFTNHCKNDCYYCGIRRSNTALTRYRLTLAEILECCRTGARLGFQTFVLQGGDDSFFTDEKIVEIITVIRSEFPTTAITLSIGEKSRVSYEKFFRAGANRYLLRHETATLEHYTKLHPTTLSLTNRLQCLQVLREIGFAVGAGFMVGSPYQTPENLLADLRFLADFQPEMIGIGPFIPHHDTPFKDKTRGSLSSTLKMIALARLLVPKALIPATTALGTISPQGREQGLQAGANVVMPNLSPKPVRKLYMLYDDKICTGDDAVYCRQCMENRIVGAGFEVDLSRGDPAK